MNPNAHGRVRRPEEIKVLRKELNDIIDELTIYDNFRPTEDYSQQCFEFTKNDLMVSIEFAEEDMNYCGVIIDGGNTICRSIITNIDELNMFKRSIRKVVRYS